MKTEIEWVKLSLGGHFAPLRRFPCLRFHFHFRFDLRSIEIVFLMKTIFNREKMQKLEQAGRRLEKVQIQE